MNKNKPLPIKQRHIDILLLLFKFRFLSRPQIQKLLKLKNHQNVLGWLNELSASDYVIKYQSPLSATATYSIGREGRRYLIKSKSIKQPLLLNRVWRELSYSSAFREKCMQIANIYLDLLDRLGGALRFWTKAELYGVESLIEPAPDAYIILSDESEANRFFLEVPTLARTKQVLSQIERYVEYFFSNVWQDHTDKPFPQIIILCENKNIIRTASRYIKSNYADEPDLRFRVASSDQALEHIQPKKKARGS